MKQLFEIDLPDVGRLRICLVKLALGQCQSHVG
jgi:hypothetical protein